MAQQAHLGPPADEGDAGALALAGLDERLHRRPRLDGLVPAPDLHLPERLVVENGGGAGVGLRAHHHLAGLRRGGHIPADTAEVSHAGA